MWGETKTPPKDGVRWGKGSVSVKKSQTVCKIRSALCDKKFKLIVYLTTNQPVFFQNV